eukprot:4323998-Pleurochrysis_carterae.AAC.5
MKRARGAAAAQARARAREQSQMRSTQRRLPPSSFLISPQCHPRPFPARPRRGPHHTCLRDSFKRCEQPRTERRQSQLAFAQRLLMAAEEARDACETWSDETCEWGD